MVGEPVLQTRSMTGRKRNSERFVRGELLVMRERLGEKLYLHWEERRTGEKPVKGWSELNDLFRISYRDVAKEMLEYMLGIDVNL